MPPLINGIPHPMNKATPRAITKGINPASNQARIACPHPTSCLVFIKYHCKIHPRHGITPTIAMRSAVTNTLPKSVSGAPTTFNPINRKMEPIINVSIKTSIINPTSPPSANI